MENSDSHEPDDKSKRPVVNNYYRIFSLFSLFSHGNNNGNGSFVNNSTQVEKSGGDVQVQPELRQKEAGSPIGLPKHRAGLWFWRIQLAAALLWATGIPDAALVFLLPESENGFAVIRGYAKYRLPDGTMVTVPEGSAVKYKAKGFQDCPEVFVSGKATFDIDPATHTVFIIHTLAGTMLTIVMDANWKEDVVEAMKVEVTERGEVTVTDQSGRVLEHVEKREKAVFEPYADERERKDREAGILRFENATLAEIATILSEEFDIAVTVRDEVKDCRIQADFYRDRLTIEEVLTTLRTATNLGLDYEFSQYHEGVTLFGRCYGRVDPAKKNRR